MCAFRTAGEVIIEIICTYECTILLLRRLLLLAFENGGRGGLNPYQTGNKLSNVELLFNYSLVNFSDKYFADDEYLTLEFIFLSDSVCWCFTVKIMGGFSLLVEYGGCVQSAPFRFKYEHIVTD